LRGENKNLNSSPVFFFFTQTDFKAVPSLLVSSSGAGLSFSSHSIQNKHTSFSQGYLKQLS